jgi:hypothetical protein
MYDIAKLLHSFDGKYDFIISDNYQCSKNKGSIDYSFRITEKQSQICDTMINALKKTYPDSLIKIKLIEALLFLSMLPLHGDHPDRQRVMLCVGIELLDGVCSTIGV